MSIKIDLTNETIENITGAQLRNLPTEDIQHVYDQDYLETLEDNDAISLSEGGFMSGYLAAM